MDFVRKVSQARVPEDSVALFWLGQAGFLFKTTAGALIAIDPYFSDCVQRLIPEEGLGFKRLMPPLCEAGELTMDALIISHEHNDHFDVDAIAAMMENGRTQVYTNGPTAAQMRDMGMDMARVRVLEKNVPVALPGCTLLPVDADHGSLAPEALGCVLDFGFTRVYYAGDTALTPERLTEPLRIQPEVAILPINGAFGNLNGMQAAQYAGMLNTKRCIPCHFWTFPLHHGDPQTIIDSMPAQAPGCELTLMCQGEQLLL